MGKAEVSVAQDRRSLGRLLRPRSLALVGGREIERVIEQCQRIGFQGEIWPVNPRRSEIAGRPCFAEVADLPEAPDAAFVAIPAEPSIGVVAALAARGAGGAICYASGFDEVGREGRARQRRLVEAAAGMPFIGPNCYGTLNYLDGIALWPDQHGGAPVERGAAIITQSGNMGINFTMQRRSLPLAYLLSLGNQAAVGIEACMEALLDDERVTAIGLHIEALGDVSRFERAALRALDQGVPVVALKTGRSETGARLALSHTASLAGPDALYDALFARLGVARAESVPTFLESLKFLALGGPIAGRRVASMSCSGGEASLVADLSEPSALSFPEMTPAHSDRVRATLNDYVAISNPLDYHTFIWADEPAMTDCFGAMLSGDFDAAMLILDYPRNDRCDEQDWWIATRAIAEAAERSGTRTAVVASLAELLPEHFAAYLIERGVAPLQGMAEALAAFEAAALIGEARNAARPAPLLPAVVQAREPKTLDEWQAKSLLREAGIATPEGQLVESVEAAVEAQRSLGGPVVLKAVSEGLAHKSEAGAVVLNLTESAAVAEAATRLLSLSDRLLVERMVTDSVAELIVGLTQDPQIGPSLTLGAGGVLVELLAESRALLLPTTAEQIRGALLGLKTAPLLQGYRGRPEGDLEAAVETALAVATLAEQGRIAELDINPLMVRPLGKGVVAADALIRLIDNDET